MDNAMKLQGIVSDIPMPTESRKDRIAREKAEAEAAKAQAKAMKNQPITKPKASMSGSDQTVTYVPQKQQQTVVDVPKAWGRMKTWLKNHKGLTAFLVLILVAFVTYISIASMSPEVKNNVADKPSSVDQVKVSDKPATDADTPTVVLDTPAKTPTDITPPPIVTADTPKTDTTPATPASVVPVDTYIVQPGDTLWDIAVSLYGDGTRWTEIAERNKDTLVFMDERNFDSLGHWIHEGTALDLQLE